MSAVCLFWRKFCGQKEPTRGTVVFRPQGRQVSDSDVARTVDGRSTVTPNRLRVNLLLFAFLEGALQEKTEISLCRALLVPQGVPAHPHCRAVPT